MPVIFEGSSPYELIAQRHPTARAEDETVELTLSVFAADSPQNIAELWILMNIEDAEVAAVQLHSAMRMAILYRRSHS